jgi:hypothetical protein
MLKKQLERPSEVKCTGEQMKIGHMKYKFIMMVYNGRMNYFSLFLGQDCGCGRLWAGTYYLSEQ